ncbi:hypothetical protein B0H14DRAFT_3158061 [Mycena olivaceomarginata]|nr:hypothetical protein B0H14DRAFT_3158061 [Mycena olivaceomarginata]
MSDHPIDPRDVLISLVTAALTAAEADAAAPDTGLIFRPEWRPEPRTRGSMSQPSGTPGLQQDQPLLSPDPLAQRTPAPEYAPPPVSVSVPPLPATSTPASPPQPQLQEDAVAELLKKNQDVFDKVINHPFPRAFGDGTASLDGFRYYMIQDKMYLETCARLKMMAVAASPEYEALEIFSVRHKSSLEYVEKLKEICITMLGIPESTINATPRSVELDASECFYMACLRKEDALLGYYVVLLPCVLTYWRIAERLMNDLSTAKNEHHVVYHPAWTVVNYDDSSVGKYTKFINENIAAKGGVDRWNHIFRIACMLEAELFNTGLKPCTPFQIIPDGTYSIHISSVDGVVLAIQDVKGLLRPPLDKLLGGYFPSDAGSSQTVSVVGMKKTGGDNERGHVFATKAGYAFKNTGTGLYLGISTHADRGKGRILQAVLDPYYWWINPVSSQPDQGSSVYQYVVLQSMKRECKRASTDKGPIQIIAHENSQLSCQMWSFNHKFEQLEYAQINPDAHKWTEYGNAEQGSEPQKTQAMNTGLGAELVAEMKKLVDKHSSEMKNLKEEMVEAIAAMGAEFDRRIKEMEERAKEQKEATDRTHRDLLRCIPEHVLRSIRAQICRWESFSGTFHSASFNPAPIKYYVDGTHFRFVGRTKPARRVPGWLSSLTEEQTVDPNSGPETPYTYQVLVGDMSRLLWAPCHGRFEVKSIGYNPVPGWDKEVGEGTDSLFIARFSSKGQILTKVKEGDESVKYGYDSAQDYEVLCYKDL